jgi:hypothetical protein
MGEQPIMPRYRLGLTQPLFVVPPPSKMRGLTVGNDGVVRILVPLDDAQDRRQRAESDKGQLSGQHWMMSGYPAMSGGQSGHWKPLSGHSASSSKRRMIRCFPSVGGSTSYRQERRQIDCLHVDLADAVAAERIAAGEAAALRAIVTGLRARPWWRCWFR